MEDFMDSVFKIGLLIAILMVAGFIVIDVNSAAKWALTVNTPIRIFGIEATLGLFVLVILLAVIALREKSK